MALDLANQRKHLGEVVSVGMFAEVTEAASRIASVLENGCKHCASLWRCPRRLIAAASATATRESQQMLSRIGVLDEQVWHDQARHHPSTLPDLLKRRAAERGALSSLRERDRRLDSPHARLGDRRERRADVGRGEVVHASRTGRPARSSRSPRGQHFCSHASSRISCRDAAWLRRP